jgi:endonuclease-3
MGLLSKGGQSGRWSRPRSDVHHKHPRRVVRKPISRLARIVAGLRAHYGRLAPPPAATAFEFVLWEKVAYLAPDERRGRAFAALRTRIGLTPQAILDADPDVLREVAALGGSVEIEGRAQRMHDAAKLVIKEFDGSLDNALVLPLRDAKRALQRIYGIGEPGAEKILLLTRSHMVLGLESNGARVLVRMGYGVEHKNYSTMYKSVCDATRPELVLDFDWLIDAHVLLRHHGQELCKTSAPRCDFCPVREDCAYDQNRRKIRPPESR